MSETLTAPVIDPSEFSPEELDEIREQERIIDDKLETFTAAGVDTDEAFKSITASIERQAVENPKAFLAAREKLSALTDEEDPTDDQLDKEDILKDAIDGPLHARTVTKYGVFAPPTPEVRARVERAIALVRDAESTEGKMARRITDTNANTANLQAYGQAQANLAYARETGNAADIETYSFAVRHLRKTMDIQSRNPGHTQRELNAVDKWIDDMRAHDPDITDDDPHMKEALRQRAEAQEDLEKVRSRIGETPATARERLRNLLKEHPEGIDVVHQLETTHDNHAASADTQKDLLKARTKHEEAAAKVADLQGRLDPGDARIAIAQIEAFTARKAYEKASEHTTIDAKNADLLTEIADENALDKIAIEDYEKVYGSLRDLENEATESILEWKDGKRPIDEHGSYVAIKKIEDYLAGLDEKIALAKDDDRFLPHYRQLRNNAFDSYMQVQYSKEFVRTEMYANAGDFEGRHSLAHTPDKGILLERADGKFIIYPDGSYSSVYEEIDAAGNRVVRQTPRVDADGERVTTPVLEQIPDPRALIEPATLRAWQAMTTENLKDVDSAVYRNWIDNPANPLARAQLEVVSSMLSERTAGDGTPYAMEALYTERYLGVGRDGTADRLLSDGSVAAHMTLFDIEGDWVIHPNGTADFYTPGTVEPIGRYAADGTVLNAYGPEEEPTPTTPEADEDDEDDTDDGSGTGSGGAPSTPTPTPSAPITPTPPVAPRPRPTPTPGPGTVSAAGAAPTPPTPPKPESSESAPKPPSTKEREAREARVRAVKAAKNHTVIMTSIAPKPGTLAPRGEYEQGKSYVPILGRTTFGDGANAYTEFRTRDELWDEADTKILNVSPETFYIGPSIRVEEIGKPGSGEFEDKVQSVVMPDGTTETLFRVQYRFDAERAGIKYPTAGDNSYPEENTLIVDAELPQSAVLGLLDAIEQNPNSVRDFARDLYAANIENGAEIWDEQGGHPPYDSLPANWQMSVIVPHRDGSNSIEVSNRTMRR